MTVQLCLLASLAFAVPAPPSSLALSRDRATLFVGVDQHFGRGGGIVAYKRAGLKFTESARAEIAGGGVQGIALTPDGSTLVATTRVGIAVLPVAPFLDGGAPAVTSVRDGDAPATNQVAISRDGRYAFYTASATATLGIARIDAAANGAPAGLTIVGHVPLDRVPDGVALSPDGRTLYVTSEVDQADPTSIAGAHDPVLGRVRCASDLGPQGTLSVVDTAKAIGDPLHAVVARVASGCSPVRVILSPHGDIAWVTARGDNRVLAFDTARLRADAAHALLAAVDVGDIPVGLGVSDDGARLLVANSHRSRDADVAADANLSLIDPAAALAGSPALLATIGTGALPREVLPIPDGAFLVTNYLAGKVDVVTIPSSSMRRNGSS